MSCADLGHDRTFPSALRRLLQWGEESLEKSVNNPTRPHIIIAINAAGVDVPRERWTPETAKENLLSCAEPCLTDDPFVARLARQWRRSRDTRINSIEDLIHCYYSSFTAVRIPQQTRLGLLQQQVDILRDQINQRCAESHEEKSIRRLLSSSDDMIVYIQSAFDHFTSIQGLDTPFDFVQESVRLNRIPQDFADHLIQLMLKMRREQRVSTRYLFDKLSRVVASSIVLHCTRYHPLGKQIKDKLESRDITVLILYRPPTISLRQIPRECGKGVKPLLYRLCSLRIQKRQREMHQYSGKTWEQTSKRKRLSA